MNLPKYSNFRVEDKGNGVVIFWGDRPAQHNAIDVQSWIEIREFFLWAEKEEEVKVVVFASAVPKVFFAGADIKEFCDMPPKEVLYTESVLTLRIMHNFRKPIIAAVHGAAFGGGFELTLQCDIRIVAEGAMFGLPETTLGIVPGAGGSQMLSKFIGIGRAKEVILGGRIIKAEECVDLGLAMKCVPEDQLIDEAVKLANKLTGRSPSAQSVAKHCIDFSFSTDFNTGIFAENFAFTALMGCPDMKEGTSAFLEKRKPNF